MNLFECTQIKYLESDLGFIPNSNYIEIYGVTKQCALEEVNRRGLRFVRFQHRDGVWIALCLNGG